MAFFFALFLDRACTTLKVQVRQENEESPAGYMLWLLRSEPGLSSQRLCFTYLFDSPKRQRPAKEARRDRNELFRPPLSSLKLVSHFPTLSAQRARHLRHTVREVGRIRRLLSAFCPTSRYFIHHPASTSTKDIKQSTVSRKAPCQKFLHHDPRLNRSTNSH